MSGAQLFVVAGYTFDPTVGLKTAFAAHTPVNGAPAPRLGIGVTPAELTVVLTKLGPLFEVPVLNKLITLAFGALRFNSRSPSKDSVALKLTAIPVTVAPVGIPLIESPVLTPAAVLPIEKVIAPEEVVVVAWGITT
jgi:hypothetical protein